jgi:glycine reductase complex component B subunit gamma
VKEIDRLGIPTVLITAMVSVAQMVGAGRIVKAGRIPHALGDPARTPQREKEWRYGVVKLALETLQTPVDNSTIWEAEELIAA